MTLDRQNIASEPLKATEENPPSVKPSLDQLAQDALVKEATGQSSDGQTNGALSSCVAIPLLMQNRVPQDFEKDGSFDVSVRAPEPKKEDNEQMPVEQFDLGMLRDIGHKPDVRDDIKPLDPKIRAKGLVLGADVPLYKQRQESKKDQNGDDRSSKHRLDRNILGEDRKEDAAEEERRKRQREQEEEAHSEIRSGASAAAKSSKLQENDKQTLLAIYKLCKRYNFSETVETFKKEVFNQQGLSEEQLAELAESADAETHISNVLSTYKSEGDPSVYEDSYARLTSFIDASLDTYRHELATFTYPVFVHMYLELVYNSHEDQAVAFMRRFAVYQEDYYMEDVRRLSVVTKKEQMKGNEIIDNFRSGQNLFTVRLSRDSYNFFKRFLNDSKNSIVHNIIQEHLYLDIYEGLTRTKQQVDCVAGSMMGEATRQANKTKVFYGLLKEPEINVQIVDDDQDDNAAGVAGGTGGNAGDGSAADGDRPKKKKIRKEIISKKSRNDPNAPPLNRIPLPESRDIDKIERINALRESAKRLKLGPNCLPSICFYTLLNANHSQNMAALCVDVSEDSNYIAAGFADSSIIVWPLGATKLRGMKSGSELELIDKEADDVLARMMDDRVKFDQKNLYGHQGPVYSVHFSPDKTLLISCSEDGTSKSFEQKCCLRFFISIQLFIAQILVRLWSLQTWTNICSYKGHCFPVWDVKFSPHGYYFASCSHDRTARLWATDSYQPLRVFAGHISDVDVSGGESCSANKFDINF